MITDRESSIASTSLTYPTSGFQDQLAASPARKSELLNWVLKWAGEPHSFYRLPLRFAQLAWGSITHINRQIEILRILTSPSYIELVRRHPMLPLRYLTRGYLSCGFTTAERASCLAHHYAQFNALLSPGILRRILYDGLTLIEMNDGSNFYQVTMRCEGGQVIEGEFYLYLKVDGAAVFTLQFTMVPGSIVKSQADDVLLISRLQGVKGCFPQIRLATKAFHDVAPPSLLFAVLQGIAEAYGIRQIAGISAGSHFYYSKDSAKTFKGAYDDFWLELGADRATGDLFFITIPPCEKPLKSVKQGHRGRARKKRIFKQQIADEVSQSLREMR